MAVVTNSEQAAEGKLLEARKAVLAAQAQRAKADEALERAHRYEAAAEKEYLAAIS